MHGFISFYFILLKYIIADFWAILSDPKLFCFYNGIQQNKFTCSHKHIQTKQKKKRNGTNKSQFICLFIYFVRVYLNGCTCTQLKRKKKKRKRIKWVNRVIEYRHRIRIHKLYMCYNNWVSYFARESQYVNTYVFSQSK